MSGITNWKPKPVKKEDSIEMPARLKEVINIYDKAGIEYVIQALDKKEIRFYQAVRQNPKSHEIHITHLYRLKVSPNQIIDPTYDKEKDKPEVLIFHMNQLALEYDNSPIWDKRDHGFIFKPNVVFQKDARGVQGKPQFKGTTPLYKLVFRPETVDKLLEQSLTEPNFLHVGYGSLRGPEKKSKDLYTVRNLEDFKEGTFEELIDMGYYNYSATEPRLALWRKEGEEIKATSRNLQAAGIRPKKA